MTGMEGIGEAITGGLVARAVEPQAGEADGQEAAVCLNCGAPLVGIYCHQCGQPGHVHRTLRAFGHDIAHSVLHFDGKIWRTLPLLAWHPGELTRRYIAGERARFVSPMALFLFSVFMMFAVFSALGGPFAFNDDPVDRAEAAQDLREEQAQSREQLAELKAQRGNAPAGGAQTREIDLEIAQLERQIAVMEATAGIIASGSQEDVESALENPLLEDRDVEANTGWPVLDAAIRKAAKNPSLLFYKIQTNAYKFSWALIPLSVPFLWLLFLHRRRYRDYRLYDHTVFVTYSIAFMSLGLIALSLLRPLGLAEAIAGIAIAFVPPIHMYRQLRGAYQLSRLSAAWRTIALLIFAFIASGLFFTLLVALGALA